jgi:biopolymer transport protein ExbD
MKLSSRKLERGTQIELQMTSMIDVVFLLLIFFMVTAAFVRTERNLDPAIKVKRSSAAQTEMDFEPTIVDVVRGQGGSFVYKLGSRELTSLEELTGVLRMMGNKFDGAFVRVSDEAPFRMAAAAVQACKSAGFISVSYVPMTP